MQVPKKQTTTKIKYTMKVESSADQKLSRSFIQ